MNDAAFRAGLLACGLVVLCPGAMISQPSQDPLASQRAFATSGRLAEAETSLRAYLANHATSAEGHFLLGYVLFREKKATASLAEFTEGAKMRRPTAEELETVASDYVLLGDFLDADKWFSRVSVERPNNAKTWYLLGRTKYNEELYEQAVSCFEHALSLQPRYMEAEDNLGLALRAVNKLDSARIAFQTAIDWQGDTPADAQPYLNLGSLLADQSKLDEAIRLLEKAVALAPDNPTTHEELGTAYEKQTNIRQAQTEMERAVALAPEISALHFKLGVIYRKEKMQDLARREFAICDNLNSTHSSTATPNPFQPSKVR